MNIELDTWEVINSYFRDIPNYLVRHHIDSYNDFIQNKIPQIMRNFAKIPILPTKLKYSMVVKHMTAIKLLNLLL
jgi:DNA-directed RNA polymerase beta subunit